MDVGQTLLSRYQVICALSKGGFGDTYLARDLALPGQPTCVVKHLRPIDSNPEVFEVAKTLFERESKTLYRLGEHDTIPRLFANFEQEGEFYLVQEYVDGHDLTVELQPDRPWTEAQTVELLLSLLKTLAVVHGQQVIHRDIKPQNIMRRHRDGQLILIDFGAVKEIGRLTVTDQGQTSLTVAIGSPGYMPIEQAAGKPKPSSDVYAVGMIAIQALTGLHPSEVTDDIEDRELLWRDRAQISDRLAEVLTSMVRQKSSERYPTAAQALAALEAAIVTPEPPPSGVPTNVVRGEKCSAPAGVPLTAYAEAISTTVHRSVSPNTKRWPGILVGFVVVTAAIVAGIFTLAPGLKGKADKLLSASLPSLPQDSVPQDALSKEDIPRYVHGQSRELRTALPKEQTDLSKSFAVPDGTGVDDGGEQPIVRQEESTPIAPTPTELINQKDVSLSALADLKEIYRTRIEESLSLYVGRREKRGSKSSSGKQNYTYYYSIVLPRALLHEVQRVKYFFNHKSFKDPIQESKDLLTSFRVSYVGWGCVRDVTVTLYLQSGIEVPKQFDVCNRPILPPHALNSISKAYRYDISWCDYSTAEFKRLATEIYSTLKSQGISGATIRPYDETSGRVAAANGHSGQIFAEVSIGFVGLEGLQVGKDIGNLLFESIGIPASLEAVDPQSLTPGYLSIVVCPSRLRTQLAD
jgi:serine/threonine protein kinase